MAQVTTKHFGLTKQGEAVQAFTLAEPQISVTVIELGAAIQSLLVADKNGAMADVVLGFDDVAGYEFNDSYFGVVPGRYANRIAGAKFELNGKAFNLEKNDGDNTLHGGLHGFSHRLWKGELVQDGVKFTLVSPDGDGGYPGTLTASVTYTLKDGELKLHYQAVSDQDTIVNLTNHSYFNLGGHDSGDVKQQLLQMSASHYCECDEQVLTTGVIAPVAGTPFDFTSAKPVGQDLDSDDAQIRYGSGYDHNFVVDGTPGTLRPVATVSDLQSGRTMKVQTDQPGVQLYTASMLGDTVGKGGTVYRRYGALCLETQHFPNAINTPNFPSPILRGGQAYDFTTTFTFFA